MFKVSVAGQICVFQLQNSDSERLADHPQKTACLREKPPISLKTTMSNMNIPVYRRPDVLKHR